MISFKEWLYNELYGKNAYKRMVMAHPSYQGMPALARKEFIDSSFGSSVNNSNARAMKAKSDGKTVIAMKPSDFLNNSEYKDRSWSKPVWLEVTPLHFNNFTLDMLIKRCFGLRPLPDIRDDEGRTETQKSMIVPGDMQPVILFQDGQKYKLQEGWHRTMSRLLWDGDDSLGAPPDQIETLKQYAQQLMGIDQQFIPLDSNQKRVNWILATSPVVEALAKVLNFQAWKPIKLKAIIGTPITMNRPAPEVDYMASTAMYPQMNPQMNPYMASTAIGLPAA